MNKLKNYKNNFLNLYIKYKQKIKKLKKRKIIKLFKGVRWR